MDERKRHDNLVHEVGVLASESASSVLTPEIWELLLIAFCNVRGLETKKFIWKFPLNVKKTTSDEFVEVTHCIFYDTVTAAIVDPCIYRYRKVGDHLEWNPTY